MSFHCPCCLTLETVEQQRDDLRDKLAAAEADGGASMQRLATLAAVARVKELEAQHDLDREFEMQGFQTAKARVAELEGALGEAAKELHQAATYLRAFGTPDVWQQADAAVAHARKVLEGK